jgi:hypothetical protein
LSNRTEQIHLGTDGIITDQVDLFSPI